jgi:hypothetical protein
MNRSDRQIGKWSAAAIVAVSAVYIVTGAIWLFTNIDQAIKIGLQPSEPYLSILEILILVSTIAILPLFAAIYRISSNDTKAYALSALAFSLLMIGMTSVVHTINLMVVRRTTNRNVAEVLALYTSVGKLSTLLAIDLLGWDLFFGFAMLFASPIFRGGGLQNAIRWGLLIGGALCLIGFSGPASGNMLLQFPAIIGYAFVFPFVCLLLVVFFSRSEQGNS